jgi:glycosyltransferase involved in cell wall biosynthesis
MIGIVHGYGLGGSGSNLWTREAVSALCNNGHTVHLVCQEPHPERYDFVAEAWDHADGDAERRFQREPARPGRCVLHRPRLVVLPTYVRPDRESGYARSILDLDDGALEDYVLRNLSALRTVSREHGVGAWHVNHAVLASEALRRLHQESGVPFAVMPHGSALEYVVQYDARMQAVARRVLHEADRVFSLNQEIRERLGRYFPDLALEEKTVTVRVGVDTERFRLVEPEARGDSVEALASALAGATRGRTPAQRQRLAEAAQTAADHEEWRQLLDDEIAYPAAPDADLEDRLRAVDWTGEPIVTFVGRIIPAKGVAALVAAFPLVLEKHPAARLVIVGTGWEREYLEAFLLALRDGDGERASQLLGWASERVQEGARPFATSFVQQLRDAGRFQSYVRAAATRLDDDRVLFTGFLEHHLLAHLFPLADVAVFPSAVAEASPLVIPEAAACGCLPMGTYFAGMKHSLDSLAPRLPPSVRPLMRLRPDPEHTARDIAANLIAALDDPAEYRQPLRAAAVEEYDWRSIAELLASELHRLSDARDPAETAGADGTVAAPPADHESGDPPGS